MPAAASGSLSLSPSQAEASAARVPGTPEARKADFGPQRRLRQSEDFVALLRSGNRRSSSGFTFFYRRRDSGGARLGILISRKHARLATDRNRIKRCIREAIRQEQHNLGPIDVLVRPPYGLKTGAGLLARVRAGLLGLPR